MSKNNKNRFLISVLHILIFSLHTQITPFTQNKPRKKSKSDFFSCRFRYTFFRNIWSEIESFTFKDLNREFFPGWLFPISNFKLKS